MAQSIMIASTGMASPGPAERRFGIWGGRLGRACDAALRKAARALSGLLALQRHWREREQLAELSDATLKDLGLSRADIDAELRRPVWQRAA
ncbi:MAG: DUF1127 domain-containing protein [Ferrovibrio sp.]|uniref:DUF1127 domain-containing protein n=1 Tax=Ferrovibrio sp. TaxID=1917215 RepID=UPI0039187169